jgi:HEAT repeat protein
MVFLRSKKRLFERLLTELKSGDPELRSRSAQKLADLGKAEAIPHLISALQDSDKKVRWRTAYALGDFGEMGYDTAFEAIVSHLKTEDDWNVRRIIVMTLRHWDDRAIPPLIKALSDESEYVRRYAAMTLGFRKARQGVSHLERLASSDNVKEVRDYAKWALDKINQDL